MNKIITHLDLDLASSNEYKVINAQQLDNNTRRLEVNLFHEGKIYDITNVTKIELQGFRGDGETIKTPLTNDGNNIIIDFDNTILGAKGICKLKIALFGEDNKLLSSFPFVIRIDQNVYDETGVIASPVYLELENELKNIEELKNEIETKLDDNRFVLKKDKDVAGGVPSLDSNTKVPIAELYEATTTRKGITQLTDSVTSTSTTTAATPNSVKSVKDSLNSEINRAKTAEKTNSDAISSETTRAKAKETEINNALSSEVTRATTAENNLESKKIDKTTVATSSTLGLVKSGTDITVDTSGNVSVNDNSHKHNVSNISDLTATASELNVLDGITATTTELNYTDGVTSNIQTQLNSKSTNGHTHDDRYYTESEVDTTVSNINNSISSHTGNTSNPHSVTKAQVGLGNVEDKSSATIRGEITKSNVTTALGYTPYTPNEIDNKFSALETNIDWKESVSTFDDIATTYPNPIDGWTVNVKDTDYTYRYNGNSWVAISANAIPKATNNVDGLLSKEDHTNYEDANSKKHTHSNKSVLDGITSTKVSNWDSAKTHADSTHARTDATKVEASSTNGNIKINGTETTVYTHPGSGTNPHGTTKSDVGLGNVGNFKAVSTVSNQGLTDTEKSNARANIGAGTSSFSGSYNDLSNKPTIPSVGNGTITITQNGTSKGTFTMNQSGNTTIELTDNNTTYGVATQSANGLESAADKKKLDGIATGAEVNQNAFSNVVVGSTTISADSKTDSLTLAGSNVTITPDADNDKVTIGITKANVTSALGYTPPTTNTTYGVATSSALGLVKSGTDITVDSSGNVSVNDDSHNHVISNVDGLQSALDGKASSSHTHTKSQITDFPTSLPASDVYAWAKEGTKPSYTALEVGALPISNKNGVEVETSTTFNKELSVAKSLFIFRDSFTNMDFTFNDSNSIPYWNYFDGESEKKLYHPNKSGTIATTDDIKMYSAGTGITLSGTTFSNSGVRSITSGSTNGTISVNTNGTSAEVVVKGLGSAAYTSSSNYASSSHTHNYAGSSSAGGSATSAVKLNSSAGSTTNPVYFSDGKPVACTYTLGKSVPSNAVFTDTWRGIQNNLTSDSTTDSLSAAQGKVLDDKITLINNSLENFIFVNVSNCVKKYSAFYNSITKMMFISFEVSYGNVATAQSITIFNDHAHTLDTNYSFPVSAWDALTGKQVLSYGYTSGKDIRIYAPPCSDFQAYGILFYHCQ